MISVFAGVIAQRPTPTFAEQAGAAGKVTARNAEPDCSAKDTGGRRDAAPDEATARVNGKPIRSAADPVPLVVRVSQQVFGAPEEPQVQQMHPIDMVVLGTRAVGQGETTGSVLVDFQPASRGAAFDLVFRGTVRTQTVSQRRAAVIGTQTWCDFELRAPVQLHRDTGFLGGCVESKVQITRVRRKVASTSRGFRGRLVRRIAARRLEAKDQTVRQLILDRTRRRLEGAFQAKFDERLLQWNRWFTAAQATLERQPWFERLPELVLETDQDHLLIGIDLERRDDQTPPPPRLPELPALGSDQPDARIEVFLGPQRLDSPAAQLTAAGAAALITDAMAESEDSPESGAQPTGAQQPWNVGVEQAGPWTVIRLSRDP